VITHGDAKFRLDTQGLRDLELRIGSLYQFIGELSPDRDSPSEVLLSDVVLVEYRRHLVIWLLLHFSQHRTKLRRGLHC
jgi:hypothetical protein